eukprot:TRINITY_DN5470_c1_g2_i4.p1 TRINITY_DN5470_c1_g2~~TRINITY_DN5470_c1_g2_i4.p1  ORF type:complete len:162 (-),score=29.16 TRINITY_DN5470_c1_g2_i4:149-598(-)
MADAQRVNQEVKQSAKHSEQATSEPKPIHASEVAELLDQNLGVIIDVREEPGGKLPSCRPAGCISLPHPSLSATFPTLPDEELLILGERLMANEGPRVIVGDGQRVAHSRHAALLLAAFLRLWPQDVRPLIGGFDSWQSSGLPVETVQT